MPSQLRLARQELREGRFQRVMALMTIFAAITGGWEAYMQHLRGAFSNRLMWSPVLLTPVVVAAGLAGLVSRSAARVLLPVSSIASLVVGVVGFALHLRGINRLPGGYKLGQYNIVMGPPIFAPLLTCVVGVLGLMAGFSRREVVREPPSSRLVSMLAGALATSRDRRPLRAVKRDITYGRFQQGLALISSFFAILAGGEAYFEHYRGSYNQRMMWTPVWLTPPMVAAGVGAAFSQKIARSVLPLVSAATFLDGILGFALHLRGIKRMPGHFENLQFNTTMGPPLFAPLLLSSVGMLGFLATMLRREKD